MNSRNAASRCALSSKLYAVTPETAAVTVTLDDGTVWELTFRRKGAAGLHLKQTSADGKVLLDQTMAAEVEKQNQQ